MAEARVFRLNDGLSLEEVAGALENYLRSQKRLETQGVRQSDTSYFIQARQAENWKKFVGMDQAVQIRLSTYQNMLTVDLGAATLGYIVCAPLMITAAIGALGQEQLPRDIFDFLSRYTAMQDDPMDINNYAAQPPVQPDPPAAQAQNLCDGCQSPLPPNARFCPSCGKPVQTEPVCPVCGTAAPAGARFCAECGASLKANLS